MIYYLGLGSNLGRRMEYLLKARERLRQLGDIVACSILYETEPFGVSDQKPFLNAALTLDTACRPFRLLRKVKSIECELGRVRSLRWGPRCIDIDIIEWQGEAVSTDMLRIPHDGLQERNFIYYALSDVCPDYTTREGHTLSFLKSQIGDRGWIKPFKENW